MPVIFFDIGATLAEPRLNPDGSLALRPLPRVLAVLDDLGELRQGIISNPGTHEGDAERVAAALHEAFPGRFTDVALVHWGAKDSRALFDRAVASAGGTADDCVFVGEDARERAFAREAGMRTAAHPVFTRAAAEDRPVLRARIESPAGPDGPDLDAAVDATEAVVVEVVSERLALAMVTARGAEALRRAGFTVDLRGPVDTTGDGARAGEEPDVLGGAEPDGDAERVAAEKFVNDLLARGEAVFEGEEPTTRTTHVITREDDGRLTARRLRFFG
ncbi:HAD family hydrolase [Streptomyces sp. NPDC056660]|uniref:HAD family hydrolase n=1 Tax=Streptomyces sp. NPDC056660 TaxID=3345897 RepID=UPI00368E23F8